MRRGCIGLLTLALLGCDGAQQEAPVAKTIFVDATCPERVHTAQSAVSSAYDAWKLAELQTNRVQSSDRALQKELVAYITLKTERYSAAVLTMIRTELECADRKATIQEGIEALGKDDTLLPGLPPPSAAEERRD